jgi:ankyrin repeat protein
MIGIYTCSEIIMDKLPKETFFQTKVLQRAILSGSLSRISHLLKSGCDPNVSCGSIGVRPLMIACYVENEHKRAVIIQLLLEAGAVPSDTDKLGRNSLYYACWLGLDTVINILLNADDSDLTIGDSEKGNTCLHISAILGHLKVLKVVVEKMKKNGITLNTKNKEGWTALSLSYQCGNMSCFKLLCDAGAAASHCINLDTVDERESTAKTRETSSHLHSAVPTSNSIIKMLLEKVAYAKLAGYVQPEAQVPITSEWIKTVQDYRQETRRSTTLNIASLVNITLKLKSLCNKRSSTERTSSSSPISPPSVNLHPIKHAPQ